MYGGPSALPLGSNPYGFTSQSEFDCDQNTSKKIPYNNHLRESRGLQQYKCSMRKEKPIDLLRRICKCQLWCTRT